MAVAARKTQDISQNPPERASQATLQKSPQAAVQKTRAKTSEEIETPAPEARESKVHESKVPKSKTPDDGGLANAEALDAMIKANETMLGVFAEFQREIMEFGSARLREDLETQEALTHCADLQEAYRVQAEFTQKAMQQYAEETAKLLNLSVKVGRDCWAPFEEATRAAFKITSR